MIVYLNGSPGELFRSLSGGKVKHRRKAVQGKGMGFLTHLWFKFYSAV